MHDPVYILIRTSGRPKFFARCMESIKAQTYPNITTIVHTDNPDDDYVEGDIIVRGEAYPRSVGTAPYNLYCNRLLEAIPDGPGWYHFIDDDDAYACPDAIERFVAASKRDHINVTRVRRWNDVVFPRRWCVQQSFQTECFLLHTDHKGLAKWWANRGGDHNYTRQITRSLKINWIDDLLLCYAQEGKGHGRKLDEGQHVQATATIPMKRLSTVAIRNELILCRYLKRVRVPSYRRGDIGELHHLPRYTAYQMAMKGKVEIVQDGENVQNLQPAENVLTNAENVGATL